MNPVKIYSDHLEVFDLDQPIPQTVDDLVGSLPWRPTVYKIGHHNGQRKLLLGEVSFLSNYELHNEIVVYAGAAPSNKTYFLSKLFPTLKFILIDPSPFNILIDGQSHFSTKKVLYFGNIKRHKSYRTTIKCKQTPLPDKIIDYCKESHHNIFIINDYMNETLAHKLYGCILISDIRTALVPNIPSELDILWNSAMQLQWIEIMRPPHIMLKLRVPWLDESLLAECENLLNCNEQIRDDLLNSDIDFIENYKNGIFIYLKGTIYLQPFSRPGSTETRLVIDRQDGTTFEEQYPLVEHKYDDKLIYFNVVCRNYKLYDHDGVNSSLGIDNCIDCALENEIWKKYKNCSDAGVDNPALEASLVIKKSLLSKGHGRRLF